MNKQVKTDDNDDDDNAFVLKTPNWLELFWCLIIICTLIYILTQVIVDKNHVNMFKVDLKELKLLLFYQVQNDDMCGTTKKKSTDDNKKS